jgi:rod shape-determining protein MreB
VQPIGFRWAAVDSLLFAHSLTRPAGPPLKVGGVLSKKIAIDLGTSMLRVFVKGEGIVVTEPSVVALKRDNARFVAFGSEVAELVRRSPDSVVVRFPLRDGVIADLAATEAMLHHFIDRVQGRQRIFKPEVMICVPTGFTSKDRRAVTEAAVTAGARQAWLIDEPLAAAMGVGLPVTDKRGSVICDIGCGTTEVAVIAESGTVAGRSIKVAGNRMDAAIAEFLRRKYNVEIDEHVAEAVKIAVGSAVPMKQQLVTRVVGRDLASGSPKMIEVHSNDVVEAIDDALRLIADALREVVEETPRAMMAGIRERGVVLSGGAARLRGLDLYIATQTGIPARVADEPETSVVRGTGLAMDNFEVLKRNQSYVR